MCNVAAVSQLLLDGCRRKPLGDLGIPLFGRINLTQTNAVVEITGEEGSGKTELLLHALVSCILPEVWHGVALGGAEAAAVFFDCDYRFSLLRLITVLESRIKSAVVGADLDVALSSSTHSSAGSATTASAAPISIDTDAYDSLISECLARLFVFRCSSSLEFLATLQSLWGLLDLNPAIRLICLDSIAALYWFDGAVSLGESNTVQRSACKLLRKLMDDFSGLTVLATKPVLFTRRDGAGEVPREYMDREWGQVVTHRVGVHVVVRADASSCGGQRSTVVLSSPVHPLGRPCSFDIRSYGCEFV